MTIRPSSLIAAAAFSLVAAYASAQPGHAYVAAVKAYRAEQLEHAAALFQRARELNSNETWRVQISGNDVLTYTPQDYLADAYGRLRNCSGAQSAFDDGDRNDSAGSVRGLLRRISAGRSKGPVAANANNSSGHAPPIPTPPPVPQAAGPPPLTTDELRFAALRTSAQLVLQEATDAERAADAAGNPQANASAQLLSARSLFDDATNTRNASRMETATKLAAASRDLFVGAVKQSGVQVQTALMDARAKLAEAQAKARRVAVLLGDQTSSTFTNATALLSRAGSRLSTGRITLEDVTASAADTRSADRTLDLLADEFGKSLSAPTSFRLRELRQDLSALERTLEGRGAAATPADRQAFSHLRELLTQATNYAKSAATDPDAMQAFNTCADDLESRIGEMTRALKSSVAPPTGIPAPLLQAASEYFAGRYEGTRTALAQMGTLDARRGVRLQAALFRAAATYALYAVGGERDASLRNAAREAVAECRRLAPTYSPDASTFSPRFLQFYASAR